MVARRSEARESGTRDTEKRIRPETQRDATDQARARDAGIDSTILARLLGAMEPEDRTAIRQLSASDLETTRRGTLEALAADDWQALARHLHVMTSLAQTVGATALAAEAGQMQTRLRAGATEGYEQNATRMDELAERAARFLEE